MPHPMTQEQVAREMRAYLYFFHTLRETAIRVRNTSKIRGVKHYRQGQIEALDEAIRLFDDQFNRYFGE